MKFFTALSFILIFISCTKTVGHNKFTVAQAPTNTAPPPTICQLITTESVSYTTVISTIFNDNCLPCHSSPGSGGINLDNYAGCKAVAQGELMDVILYNPGNIQMPPSPQKLLDSCQIKALTLWIKQGCLY
jgi:hypothetical protein